MGCIANNSGEVVSSVINVKPLKSVDAMNRIRCFALNCQDINTCKHLLDAVCSNNWLCMYTGSQQPKITSRDNKNHLDTFCALDTHSRDLPTKS